MKLLRLELSKLFAIQAIKSFVVLFSRYRRHLGYWWNLVTIYYN